MNKSHIIIVVIAVFIVAALTLGVQFYKKDNPSSISNSIAWSNVKIIDNKQEITIIAWSARYTPMLTRAKAWLPTTLKIQGKNAYGCESAVRIPQLSYSKNLDSNGSDVVDLWVQNAWSVMNGMCAMGMYNFQIKFE